MTGRSVASEDREALLLWLAPALERSPRVRAAWIEGPGAPRSVPDRTAWLDLHIGADEDVFPAMPEEVEALVGSVRPLRLAGWKEAPFEGVQAWGTIGEDLPVRVTIERMALVAKRPREAIRVLVDRSGRFLRGLTYGKRPDDPVAPDGA